MRAPVMDGANDVRIEHVRGARLIQPTDAPASGVRLSRAGGSILRDGYAM